MKKRRKFRLLNEANVSRVAEASRSFMSRFNLEAGLRGAARQTEGGAAAVPAAAGSAPEVLAGTSSAPPLVRSGLRHWALRREVVAPLGSA